MIKVLIADDHKVFRDGIRSILNDVEDMQVVGEAKDGLEVLRQMPDAQPDVVLMDISMGNAGGIETTKFIKEQYPHTKVLVLSMHSENTYVIKMLEAGSDGYLLKDAGSVEMINAIRTVAKGDSFYSSAVSNILVQHFTKGAKFRKAIEGIPLTKREIEVLRLIAEEYSNPEIAEKLYISIRTVDTHRRNLLEKLGAKNTAGLVKYAIKKGLIEG